MKALELEKVSVSRKTLVSQGKPIEPGRIIAELPFGFWSGLFNAPYESILWQKYLTQVFPHAPRKERTRSNLSRKLNRIRQIRNRIFHHEPVWSWWDLARKHADIVEAIGWISPELQELLKGIDRFPEIHMKGISPYKVTTLLKP